MLLFLPDQAAQAVVHETPSLQVAIVGLVLGLGQFLTWISGKRRGDHGKTARAEAFAQITTALVTLKERVEALSSHVIGPDGTNGVRGDMREMKRQVDGLLERERDTLANPPYDRRRS